MLIKFPKDDKTFSWTRHIKNKMVYYGLSEQKIRTVFKSPDRREEGIAENTVAVMKKNHKKNRKEEIWIMYQTKNKKLNSKNQNERSKSVSSSKNPSSQWLNPSGSRVTMISAWRYPGITKAGQAIQIPDNVLGDLKNYL